MIYKLVIMNLFQSIIHWENVMMISKEQSTVILSNVLNYVVKKTEYDESVQKVNTTELDKILKKTLKMSIKRYLIPVNLL